MNEWWDRAFGGEFRDGSRARIGSSWWFRGAKVCTVSNLIQQSLHNVTQLLSPGIEYRGARLYVCSHGCFGLLAPLLAPSSRTSPQKTTTFLSLSLELLLSFPPSHGLIMTESPVNLASRSRRVRAVLKIVRFLRVPVLNFASGAAHFP